MPVEVTLEDTPHELPSAGGGLFRPKLLRHMAISGALGFFLAIVLSSILYLIMTNTVFAICFAIVLLLCGVTFFARSAMQVSPNAPMMSTIARLGALSVSLGAFLVLADHYFLASLGAWFHMVCFSTASSAASYALCYIGTDLYNKLWRDGSEFSAKQLYTICGFGVLLGCVSGFFFAIVDVEDHVNRFGYEEWITAFLGLGCGACVGFVNFHATDEFMMFTFEPLPMDDVITPTHEEEQSAF